MSIVDPAIGAMYKFDNTGITENLSKWASATSTSLNILDKNQMPKSREEHLLKLN